jgi:hypothetical protein
MFRQIARVMGCTALCCASALAQIKPQAAPSGPQPYTAYFPAPSFPTTARNQQQFTVEYVYRYYTAAYNPPVAIHAIPKTEYKLDTPENVLIAQISAASSLDYSSWISLWDGKSQQLFQQEAVSRKHDEAFWKNVWQKAYQGHDITLVKRIETELYVILEYRIGPAPAQNQPDTLLPIVMKSEGKKWVVTRELDGSGFFPDSLLGGTISSTSAQLGPAPDSPQPAVSFASAQRQFLKNEPRGAQSATQMAW